MVSRYDPDIGANISVISYKNPVGCFYIITRRIAGVYIYAPGDIFRLNYPAGVVYGPGSIAVLTQDLPEKKICEVKIEPYIRP
jgi:hypothetical protein